jgi:glycosyl transferase, family 25
MHSFFINLNRRIDRRLQFETEASRMRVEVERFSAIAHRVPAIGCTMSHLAVLKLARARGYERVCIFEDDFQFTVSNEEYRAVIAAIPSDFDVVMLGWYINESLPYNDVFGKVLSATTASAYIVNRKFYDTMIATLETAASLFQANPYDISAYINDQYWIRIQPTSNWLYSLKRIGRQRPGYSDLVGAHVVYDY